MIDLLRLCAFNAAYAQAIDNDELERWPSFFAEQCLYRITNVENEREGLPAGIVYADSRAMLEDRIAACARPTSTSASATATSWASRWWRRPTCGGAVARTPFLVVRIMATGESSVFASGEYRDRFVLRAQAAAGRAHRGVRQHGDRHAAGAAAVRRRMTRRIAVTLGDPNGIGPEIVLKALAALRGRHARACHRVRPADVLERAAAVTGLQALLAKLDVRPAGAMPRPPRASAT
jgi:3-phenylpropionate/cinnamic acid dioxygenase small subunit